MVARSSGAARAITGSAWAPGVRDGQAAEVAEAASGTPAAARRAPARCSRRTPAPGQRPAASRCSQHRGSARRPPGRGSKLEERARRKSSKRPAQLFAAARDRAGDERGVHLGRWAAPPRTHAAWLRTLAELRRWFWERLQRLLPACFGRGCPASPPSPPVKITAAGVRWARLASAHPSGPTARPWERGEAKVGGHRSAVTAGQGEATAKLC